MAQQLRAEERVLASPSPVQVGLDSADLNGKSDPYVILKCGGHEAQQSTVKPKTLNPVGTPLACIALASL